MSIDFDKFSTKLINHRLVCSLCNGYYCEATTIGECLHTFCKSCITKHFLVERCHTCPDCGISLKPNPLSSTRYDSTLQDIVDAILPELAVEDARAQRDFHLERKEPVPAAVLEKIASAAPQPVEEPQSPVKRQRTGDAAKSKMQYDDIVTFHLVPDEGCDDPLPALDKCVLRTSAAITVQALKKFIISKLRLKGIKPQQMTLKYGDSTLGSEHTVHYIFKTIAFDEAIPHFRYAKIAKK
eukprot:TRINITY_DN888_c0_g1_i1.p1 TRINITY_DN888_c0_g1~~TRINITY_DN888_c0_g1_i1.p1  ORF type:complete len:240 (+),score=43.84 TRINITY_DN888_c0_g1_i1:90-809(+)